MFSVPAGGRQPQGQQAAPHGAQEESCKYTPSVHVSIAAGTHRNQLILQQYLFNEQWRVVVEEVTFSIYFHLLTVVEHHGHFEELIADFYS